MGMKRVKDYMDEKGLSYRKFADLCNVDHTTIFRLITEEGKEPSPKTAKKIAKATGLRLTDIYCED